MPLTNKGKKIMKSMKEQYGAEEGERVFYASKNKGKIKGVEKASYVIGFLRKCAELGLKPEALVKQAQFLSTAVNNPIVRGMNRPLSNAYRANALVQGSQPMSMAQHIAHDPASIPGATYELAELAGMGSKGLARLAPHTGRAAGALGRVGTGAGAFAKRVAPPAWAASQLADFGSMAFKDPNTGHWTTKHVGQNLANNINQEAVDTAQRMNKYRDFYGNVGGNIVGTAAGGLHGFLHPGRAITSAVGGLGQTAANLGSSVRGMGLMNTLRSFFTGYVPPPSAKEMAAFKARYRASKARPAPVAPAGPPQPIYSGGVTNMARPVSMPLQQPAPATPAPAPQQMVTVPTPTSQPTAQPISTPMVQTPYSGGPANMPQVTKTSEAKAAYLDGFMAKAAELGVDPEELAKVRRSQV